MIAAAKRGNLTEMTRPKSFDEVVGCQEVIARLEQLDECVGIARQAIYISGKSGTGKTTLARIIANRVAEPCCIEEMDAQDLTVDKLRAIKSDCQFTPLFGETLAYVVNEFHNVNTKTVSMLLTVLEDSGVQKNSTWIFTTTTDGQQFLFDRRDSLPLLGRMLIFEIHQTEDDYIAMAERLAKIATKYKLGKPDVPKCRKLIADCGGSMRAAIQAVAVGALA